MHIWAHTGRAHSNCDGDTQRCLVGVPQTQVSNIDLPNKHLWVEDHIPSFATQVRNRTHGPGSSQCSQPCPSQRHRSCIAFSTPILSSHSIVVLSPVPVVNNEDVVKKMVEEMDQGAVFQPA